MTDEDIWIPEADARRIAAIAKVSAEHVPALRKALQKVAEAFDEAADTAIADMLGQPGAGHAHDRKNFRQLQGQFRRTLKAWRSYDEALREEFEVQRSLEKPRPPEVGQTLTQWMDVCDHHNAVYTRGRGKRGAGLKPGQDQTHDLRPLWAIYPHVKAAWKAAGKKGWTPGFEKGTEEDPSLDANEAGQFFLEIANACRTWCVADVIPAYIAQDCRTITHGQKNKRGKSPR